MSVTQQECYKPEEPVIINTPARGGRGSARVLNEGVLSNQGFGPDRKSAQRTGRADLTKGRVAGPCLECEGVEACQLLGVRNANSPDCASKY